MTDVTRRTLLAGTIVGATAAVTSPPLRASVPRQAPLAIREQGSFAAGGSIVQAPGTYDPRDPASGGQTLHGDHAYVFYQVPENARPLPLVFWHGTQQFSKTWETTPDGREGFQTIFLRRQHSVYVIDQPRRGRAGRTTVATEITAVPDEQRWFGIFRLGIWPNYFPGVQFARDSETLNQYFRQITPNTGPFDLDIVAGGTVALFERIGKGVLVTHSESGGLGWRTASRSPHVRGIVSFEPGSNFPFPEGEVPEPIESSAGPLKAIGVPLSSFMALTRIPVLIIYGDNIPATRSDNAGADGWRARMAMARLWRDAVNARGGKVELVHLPEAGIRGNTHFPFSDLNNLEIADLVSAFLSRSKLA